MTPEEKRALGHRVRRVRERLEWDRTRLAERLGVHPGSIARWETGGSAPQAYHLEQLADWGGVSAEWLRRGDPEASGDQADAEEVFASLDAVTRFLGGIAPAGEERLRKLDALEGLRRMLTARGTLPDWWYQLRERVEGDEL